MSELPALLPLRTDRLIIRAPLASDETEFVRVWEASWPAWSPWFPVLAAGVTPADAARSEITKAHVTAASGTHLRCFGFTPDGELVGGFHLNEIVRGAFQCAYAGWSIAAEHWGRGFATEGARALLKLAFRARPEGLGLHRVQANVIPDNVASMRVAEKLGFRREGTAREYLRIGGAWRDHAMFAMLANEWGE